MPVPQGVVIALVFVVVVCACIGGLIVLYFRSKKNAPGAPKEGDRGFERENRLFALFQNIEDMMDGFESYVQETRASLEMERIEFLREKEEITRMHARMMALLQQFREEVEAARSDVPEAAPPAAQPAPEPEPEPAPALPEPAVQPSSARAQSIWTMHLEGKSVSDISRELGIAYTEVSLTLKVLLGTH